jgi:hypothetical protein
VRRYPVAAGALLAGVLLLCAAIYLRAGIAGAFLAADDFQWLAGGQRVDWGHLVHASSRDHFYRPVIEAWFALTVAACGYETACYHMANVTVHLLNVALVFSLGLALFKDLRVAFLAALIFAIEPGSTQAVVWVSAVTGLLATMFCVASLLAQVLSWTTRTRAHRLTCDFCAVALFAAALFAHEAASTLPVVAWIMWRQFGPGGLSRRPVLLSGAILALGTFAVATWLANSRNYVFTQGHYAFGLHAVRHAFEYFVALYVGPGWWLAYAACAAALLVLLVMTPITRFGALWLLVTLLPYIWFTWGNASRYLYLPAIGFGFAVAGAVAAGCDYVTGYVTHNVGHNVTHNVTHIGGGHRASANTAFVLMALFVAIRFGRFNAAAIRGQVESMEHWRTYAWRLVAAEFPHPAGGSVRVVAVPDSGVDRVYIEPMVRWMNRDYRLTVVVE